MKHNYLLVLFLLFASFTVYSQGAIEKNSRLSDKIFWGGGFGMSFGNATSVHISPMVGYKPLDDLFLGVKGTYEFYKSDYPSYATDIYGASIFGTYIFKERIALYAEYEALNLEHRYFGTTTVAESDRFWVGNALVGGGISQSVGPRSKVLFLALWNLNETEFSPNQNPIFRVTFLF